MDFTTSHVKWRVSSLSNVGPVYRSSRRVKHNGSVLIYKERNEKGNNKTIFQVYLALNNDSEIKVIKQKDQTKLDGQTRLNWAGLR